MIQKLPKSVFWIAATVLVVFVALGEYLEFAQNHWLGQHPIISNMIANVDGFASATIVGGLGLNALIRRSDRLTTEKERDAAAKPLLVRVFVLAREIGELIPGRTAEFGTVNSEAATFGQIINYASDVFADVAKMKVKSTSELISVCQHGDELFRDYLSPFAEKYLKGYRPSRPKFLADTASALENAIEYTQVPLDDSEMLKHALNNFSFFGNYVVEMLRSMDEARVWTD